MYTWKGVADWILQNINNVTEKKLQRLMYFAYAWYLVFYNESANEIENRLFDEYFESWIHGPVLPALYQDIKEFHGDDIPKNYFKKYRERFSTDTLSLFGQIKKVYGAYNGNQLESIAHQEDPWIHARKGCSSSEICNNIITDEEIFTYYTKRIEEGWNSKEK